MDSFKDASGTFCYHASGAAAAGLLDVYVHHARNIHNICIYANQDVYAKFSLTCSPDDALSTRIVAGGGKNPQFDQALRITVTQPDAVLKCEIWMLSRARNYLEDQLLGFALVPLSMVAAAAKGRLTQDFTLSSTDLFHSPAGTIQLTLSLDAPLPSDLAETSSITSEVVLLDPAEYGRIEFPDFNIARENQEMVSEYFGIADHSRSSKPAAPFLHLRASSQSMEDYEMLVNSGDSSASPDGSIQNSGNFTSSTTTTLSDDRNSADSFEKKCREDSNNNSSSGTNKISPETPTSKIRDQKDTKASKNEQGEERDKGGKMEVDSVFKSPLGNINLEAEQSAMQQQIIDMYMRSMQQFTESLAKMKLPMELDNPKSGDGGDVVQSDNGKPKNSQKKKDGGRVFYGSRAFF